MLLGSMPITGKNPFSVAQTRLPREVIISQVQDHKDLEPSRLRGLIANVRKSLNLIRKVDLRFKVHEASGKIMVMVVNESSGEVIREIPSSEILNLSARIEEMIKLLFHQKDSDMGLKRSARVSNRHCRSFQWDDVL